MSTATSAYKSSKHVNNDPWAVLIALASLIIVATIAAIIVVCILWKRYRRKRDEFERSIQQVVYQDPQEYEIQSLDMFVPQEDREDLGEVHVGFSPTDGIQHVHHVKEIQMQNPNRSTLDNPAFNNRSNEFQNPTDDSIKMKDTSLYKRVMHYSKLGGHQDMKR